MKYHLYSFALLCAPFFSTAQTNNPKKTESFRLSLGASNNGTGDIKGIAMEFAYVIPLARQLDLSTGFGTTMHFASESGYYDGYSNNGLHFVVAGFQLTPELQYAVLSFPRHSLQLIGGGMLRFQSTSMPEIYSVSAPTASNPFPTYTINDFGKQNTFSPGYRVGLAYIFSISSRWDTGIKAIVQNDTQGDVITQLSLVVGRTVRTN